MKRLEESQSDRPDQTPIRVLIVDDNAVVANSLARVLRDESFAPACATSAVEAEQMLDEATRPRADRAAQPFQVVLADIRLVGPEDLQLLQKIRSRHPDVAVIVITAYGTIESAVRAIKLGAFDYLTHPIVEDELATLVGKAARHAVLIAQNRRLKATLDERAGLGHIIGHDPRMQRVYDLVAAVAPTNTTVLMTGESGTGKSLIARAIHQRSQVADGPYVEVSCGSIPETLLESELFGHVKGAFTGAHADKAGRFLAADGGTLFLDEINSASPGMQLKLLRVLQERRFEPVGTNDTVEVDVRVVLASNQPLEDLVASGAFRQDLYYRINVVKIELPPLRARSNDIPLLAEHFLDKYAAEMKRHIAGFTPEAMEHLKAYAFPGNVRELENAVQHAVVLCRRGTIAPDDLPPSIAGLSTSGSGRDASAGRFGGHAASTSPSDAASPDTEALIARLWDGDPLSEAMERIERAVLLAALSAHEWNRQRTSDCLGINRTTLYKKMRHHGLDRLADAG